MGADRRERRRRAREDTKRKILKTEYVKKQTWNQ